MMKGMIHGSVSMRLLVLDQSGIKVRKNAFTKAKGSPSRRKAVLAQQEDMQELFQHSMNQVVKNLKAIYPKPAVENI